MGKENLQNAIDAHAQWKERLSSAIDKGTSDFDPEVVKLPDRCEFGKWLYGDMVSDDIKNTEHYAKAETLHSKFHEQAAKVLVSALEGNKEEAQQLMGPGSEFDQLSSELTDILNEWMAV
jgi:hypothetical protein